MNRIKGHPVHTAAQSEGLSARVILVALIATLTFTFLIPASALALTEGRSYEMVTPIYKAGYGGVIEAAAPDGETVAYDSLGAFANVPWDATNVSYVAHRGPTGWTTTPLQPPFPESGVSEYSSNLEYALGGLALEGEKETEYILHRVGTPDVAASWEAFGGIAFKPAAGSSSVSGVQQGASADLCDVVVAGSGLSPEVPVQISQLYDLSRGCHGEPPSLRLVAARNKLGPHEEPEPINASCGVQLGGTGGSGVQPSQFNAVSADGREVFFSENANGASESKCSGENNSQVFVRLAGSRTLEVSRSLDTAEPFGGCGDGGNPGEVPGEVPCPGPAKQPSSFFMGASEDGSWVFFTTSASLVGGDEDGKNDLYAARIACPQSEPECEAANKQVTELVQVSHDPVSGQAAEVLGVVRVAQQGTRVYFVARGVLSEGVNAEGAAPVAGADNLYVYDVETKALAFVANGLCSGILWEGSESEAQSSADGRFLVFGSCARLISSGPQADTDAATDIYRYDAETGRLDRVSLGEGGHDANGNNSAFAASIQDHGLGGQGNVSVVKQHELALRAISEDGSRVIFSTVEPLSPAAVNGHLNVYIWHKEPGWGEGRASLISSGNSLTDDYGPVMTPDGRDVFFMTSGGLVPLDTAGDTDVYDARLDGGFPQPPAQRQPCSSDACQGPLTNPAPLLVAGSVSQAPGGNYAVPSAKHTVKAKKVKPKRKKRQRKRRALKGSRKARKSTVGRSGR